MAEYKEYKVDNQMNLGWNQSFAATAAVPMIAKRVWNTLEQATLFVKQDPTAVAGLILTVTSDPNSNNNGVYFVESVGTTNGSLKKLDSGLEVPVTGVDANDKILGLSDGKVTANVSFTRATINDVDSLVVYGKDGSTVLGSVPVADFVADGMLESVTPVDGKAEFKFTFKKGNGTTEDFIVDFSKYVDTYHADDETIELDSATNTFKVKDDVFDAHGAAYTAEENAKGYADSLVKDEDGNSLFDAAGSAADAEKNAKDYADGKFQVALENGSTENPHLIWNGTENKWAPGKIEVPTLEEMVPEGAEANQVLSWNGENFEWATVEIEPELPTYTTDNHNQVLSVIVRPVPPGEEPKAELTWVDGITYNAEEYENIGEEDEYISIASMSNNEISASYYTTNAIDKMFEWETL